MYLIYSIIKEMNSFVIVTIYKIQIIGMMFIILKNFEIIIYQIEVLIDDIRYTLYDKVI